MLNIFIYFPPQLKKHNIRHLLKGLKIKSNCNVLGIAFVAFLRECSHLFSVFKGALTLAAYQTTLYSKEIKDQLKVSGVLSSPSISESSKAIS